MINKTKKWLFHSVSSLIGVGLLGIFIAKSDLKSLLLLIKEASVIYFIAALVIYALSWIPRTWRLKLCTFNSNSPISNWQLFKLHISGYALNSLLPAKLGDAATIAYLKTQGLGIGHATVVVVQTRLLDLYAMLVLTFIIGGQGLPHNDTSNIITLFFYGLLILPIAIVFIDRKNYISKIIDLIKVRIPIVLLKKMLDKLNDIYCEYRLLVTHVPIFIQTLILSLLIWVMESLTALVFALALNQPLMFYKAVIAMLLANLSKSIPLTPGGIGIYESVYTATLVGLGVDPTLALALALIDHNSKKLFNIIIGIPITSSVSSHYLQSKL